MKPSPFIVVTVAGGIVLAEAVSFGSRVALCTYRPPLAAPWVCESAARQWAELQRLVIHGPLAPGPDLPEPGSWTPYLGVPPSERPPPVGR